MAVLKNAEAHACVRYFFTQINVYRFFLPGYLEIIFYGFYYFVLQTYMTGFVGKMIHF